VTEPKGRGTTLGAVALVAGIGGAVAGAAATGKEKIPTGPVGEGRGHEG